jgi:hypothetical protein
VRSTIRRWPIVQIPLIGAPRRHLEDPAAQVGRRQRGVRLAGGRRAGVAVQDACPTGARIPGPGAVGVRAPVVVPAPAGVARPSGARIRGMGPHSDRVPDEWAVDRQREGRRARQRPGAVPAGIDGEETVDLKAADPARRERRHGARVVRHRQLGEGRPPMAHGNRPAAVEPGSVAIRGGDLVRGPDRHGASVAGPPGTDVLERGRRPKGVGRGEEARRRRVRVGRHRPVALVPGNVRRDRGIVDATMTGD